MNISTLNTPELSVPSSLDVLKLGTDLVESALAATQPPVSDAGTIGDSIPKLEDAFGARIGCLSPRQKELLMGAVLRAEEEADEIDPIWLVDEQFEALVTLLMGDTKRLSNKQFGVLSAETRDSLFDAGYRVICETVIADSDFDGLLSMFAAKGISADRATSDLAEHANIFAESDERFCNRPAV